VAPEDEKRRRRRRLEEEEEEEEGSSNATAVVVVPFSVSCEQLRQDRETITQFLLNHKCYDIMPVSGKIVVLDTALPVKAAFVALIDNDVKSAPLWDSEAGDFVGMITVSDFRNILRHFHATSPGADLAPLLENHEIRTWRRIMGGEMSDGLIAVRPEESLHGAAWTLLHHRIHRLPIMDPVDRTILHIITHRKINNFLVKNLAGAVGLLGMSIQELGIGTFVRVITVGSETPVIGVLDLLAQHNISAVPVVDERGVAIGVYANSDIVDMARRRTFTDLDRPVSDILQRRGAHQVIHSCHPKDTLQQVLQRFNESKVHRLIAIDRQGRVLGIVSLSDILKAFLDPSLSSPSLPRLREIPTGRD